MRVEADAVQRHGRERVEQQRIAHPRRLPRLEREPEIVEHPAVQRQQLQQDDEQQRGAAIERPAQRTTAESAIGGRAQTRRTRRRAATGAAPAGPSG